jgi:hypothetical protein
VLTLLSQITSEPFLQAPTSLLASKTSIDVLMNPVFLAEASLFISELVSVVTTVAFSCSKSLPKRKSAKAAKAKGAAAPADPDQVAVDAVSLMRLLDESIFIVSVFPGSFGSIQVLRSPCFD